MPPAGAVGLRLVLTHYAWRAVGGTQHGVRRIAGSTACQN